MLWKCKSRLCKKASIGHHETHLSSINCISLFLNHPWSPPHSIPGKPEKPGKPEQPKVYARTTRKTPENSGKPKQPKVNARKTRWSRVVHSCSGFPGFSRVFRIVFLVFRDQEGVVEKNLLNVTDFCVVLWWFNITLEIEMWKRILNNYSDS